MANSFRFLAGFVIVVLGWGLNFLFLRLGQSYTTSLWLAFFTTALGAAVCWMAIAALKVGGRVRLTPRKRNIAILLGIPGNAVFLGFLSKASSALPAGEVSIVSYSFPIAVLFFSVPLLGERLTLKRTGTALLGFGGIVLIALTSASSLGGGVLPVVENLISMLGWSITLTIFKRLYVGEEMLSATALMLTGSLIPLGIWAQAERSVLSVHFSPDLLLILLWTGALATGAIYVLWFRLVARYNAASLSTSVLLVPVVALIASVLLLGEPMTWVKGAGVCLVLGSTIVMSRLESATQATVPPP